MVVDTKRRMMMSKRKKSPAERLLELSKRRLGKEFESGSISKRRPYKSSSTSSLIATLKGGREKIPVYSTPIPGGGDLGILTSKPSIGSTRIEQLFGPGPKIRAEIEYELGLRTGIKKIKAAIRHQRKRAIKGAADIISGQLPDSSWIRALEYIPTDGEMGNVHADFTKRWYTFLNVPETLFNAWYAGAAATTTSDDSKARRWNINDFPSLGAFFNQRIRGKYGFHRGRF